MISSSSASLLQPIFGKQVNTDIYFIFLFKGNNYQKSIFLQRIFWLGIQFPLNYHFADQAERRKVFELLDNDNDGKISFKELQDGLLHGLKVPTNRTFVRKYVIPSHGNCIPGHVSLPTASNLAFAEP